MKRRKKNNNLKIKRKMGWQKSWRPHLMVSERDTVKFCEVRLRRWNREEGDEGESSVTVLHRNYYIIYV